MEFSRWLFLTAARDNRILITRPVRAAMILHILGLVALGCLMIGSMVASGLLLFGPGRTSP